MWAPIANAGDAMVYEVQERDLTTHLWGPLNTMSIM